VIDSSIVSLWFALRAAVLRLAVSQLRSMARQRLRIVAAVVARGQNQPVRPSSIGLSPRAVEAVASAAEKCILGTVGAVRANPTVKRTCLRHAAYRAR